MKRRIHAAPLFPLSGSEKHLTWCGRHVGADQLAIVGTDREVNCRACAQSRQARSIARLFGGDHREIWKDVLNT